MRNHQGGISHRCFVIKLFRNGGYYEKSICWNTHLSGDSDSQCRLWKEIDIEVKLENPDEGIYIEGLDTRMLIRKTENNIESIKSNELLDEFDDLIGIE